VDGSCLMQFAFPVAQSPATPCCGSLIHSLHDPAYSLPTDTPPAPGQTGYGKPSPQTRNTPPAAPASAHPAFRQNAA
jgi:hypothetical protein